MQANFNGCQQNGETSEEIENGTQQNGACSSATNGAVSSEGAKGKPVKAMSKTDTDVVRLIGQHLIGLGLK